MSAPKDCTCAEEYVDVMAAAYRTLGEFCAEAGCYACIAADYTCTDGGAA